MEKRARSATGTGKTTKARGEGIRRPGGGPSADPPGKRVRVTASSTSEEPERGEERTALALATRAGRKAAGLLFGGPGDKALMLVSCCDVHTVGMRRAIDVAFVDATGRVVEAHRNVGPLRRLRNRKAVAVVERFASCDAPWFSAGDQVMISNGKGALR